MYVFSGEKMTEEKYNIEIIDFIPNSQPLIRKLKGIPKNLVIFWFDKMESKDKIIIEKI